MAYGQVSFPHRRLLLSIADRVFLWVHVTSWQTGAGKTHSMEVMRWLFSLMYQPFRDRAFTHYRWVLRVRVSHASMS